MTMRPITFSLAVLLGVGGLLAGEIPARASDLVISGFVTDAVTGARLPGVCVARDAAGSQCLALTDSTGYFASDAGDLGASAGQTWDLYFIKSGYQTAYSERFVLSAPVRFNQVLAPGGQGPLCPSSRPDPPTRAVYLPNVTKTLGGGAGWQTPFIVQNTGTQATTLEVSFYRFLNGACARRRVVSALAPATSFADVPNNDNDLPGDTQFAVVVRSFGAPVVSVVNGHAGAGVVTEVFSYVGTAVGANKVFLPNITRRFFGYVTPFIIQNLGSAEAAVTASFIGFDGSPGPAIVRQIPVGGSKFIDPNSEPGLVDGRQYSVTVTSAQPVSVVVNTHNDAFGGSYHCCPPTIGDPVAYATNGIAAGAPRVYGPYAAKNAPGGHVSTIVVQNMSANNISPRLDFAPLGGTGPTQSFASPSPIAPGASWAFDPRSVLGTTTPCTASSATCLGEGEYSFVADSGDATASIGVAVNVISPTTAAGYTGIAAPATKVFAPNVTRVLGGPPGGWTTPILLQSVTATAATVEWRRFSDGQLVLTQTVQVPPGRAMRIDPRDVAGLSDNTQYSVVMTGTGGTIAAVVRVSAIEGDAAFYEAFAEPAAP